MTATAHILLVEDDQDHAELMRTVFARSSKGSAEGRGVTISHLPDGSAAMAYLEGLLQSPRGESWPRCILLDLRLPKQDGLDILKAIKSNEALRTIPVIILTTSASEEDMARAYAMHANSYVVKPVHFKEFSALLAALGDYWIGVNRQPG